MNTKFIYLGNRDWKVNKALFDFYDRGQGPVDNEQLVFAYFDEDEDNYHALLVKPDGEKVRKTFDGLDHVFQWVEEMV